ncbi:MAG: hypothetical protein F6K00_19770 [Leptolyngbya sp. SIOISBB]|nr:hypothetical protein [Leptolyngbya sp. SIOISBB]
MTRFEIVDRAILSALQFGNDSGYYTLGDWLRDCRHVGLFIVAVLLNWRLPDDPEHLLIDETTGPFCSEVSCYIGTSQTIEVKWFGHPWLPVYMISIYPS